jgi:hypothetical protein
VKVFYRRAGRCQLYERWKTLEGIVTKNLREHLRDAQETFDNRWGTSVI